MFQQCIVPGTYDEAFGRDTDDDKILILLEIVGATGLRRRGKMVDPYCIVRCGKQSVHRTKALAKQENPIWTYSTGSLCLLEIPESDVEDGELGVDIWHRQEQLGVVQVPFQHILKCEGEREEYQIVSTTSAKHKKGRFFRLISPKSQILSLRFRRASTFDIRFMRNREARQPLCELIDSPALDTEFKFTQRRNFLKAHTKFGAGGQLLYRVQPGPDPDRPDETAWMTCDQLDAEAMKPSKNWVECGNGHAGTLYLEILSCNAIPNLDIPPDKTDAFANVVFEESSVRTHVIFTSLNPRWMPWSTRAFAFNIHHPNSILFIGVFDFDRGALTTHDEAGRVTINLANFVADTVYLLEYKLQHHPQLEQDRGTLKIRLRLEWENPSQAQKMALQPAPRFLINVESKKAWDVVHYCTVGAIDINQPSVTSIKLFVSELHEYWIKVCYILDVICNILLWRGQAQLTFFGRTYTVWNPIHSVFLFVTVTTAFEYPKYIPPLFFLSIWWIMVSINFHSSRHPNPWKRVKKVEESIAMMLSKGKQKRAPVSVQPNEGVEEGELLEKLDAVMAERASSFIIMLLSTLLKIYNIYSGTKIAQIAETTVERGGIATSLIQEKIYYPHLILKLLTIYVRKLDGLITWKTYLSLPATRNLMIITIMWFVFPVDTVALNLHRLFIWVLLGPWMKLFDIFYYRKYRKTKEELLEDLRAGKEEVDYKFEQFFESILENKSIHRMTMSGRKVTEHALKHKDMRDTMFGAYSEETPASVTSRYPFVPLSTSSAVPLSEYDDLGNAGKIWERAPTQRLAGEMIMTRVKQHFRKSSAFSRTKKIQ